jgi:kynurenine 3-monooxygenase
VPKYAMVTFHRVPYSVAMSRGITQDKILSELCDGVSRIEELDWTKADRLIHAALTPLEFAA